MKPDEAEGGNALVAAVAAMAVCALAALAIAGASQTLAIGGQGDAARARAEAAVDAGLAITLHHLVALDEVALQAMNGRPSQYDVDSARVTVTLFDERGKVAINNVDVETLSRMLEQGGLSGAALDTARDSLMDWIDNDDQARPNGAESAEYAGDGIAPRNSAILSLDELARVRGFSPALVEQLHNFATVDTDASPFDETFADPRALAAMSASGKLSPAALDRAREASGDQVALSSVGPAEVLHRPIRVVVEAEVAGGGNARHEMVVELSGKPHQPWSVHAVD